MAVISWRVTSIRLSRAYWRMVWVRVPTPAMTLTPFFGLPASA